MSEIAIYEKEPHPLAKRPDVPQPQPVPGATAYERHAGCDGCDGDATHVMCRPPFPGTGEAGPSPCGRLDRLTDWA